MCYIGIGINVDMLLVRLNCVLIICKSILIFCVGYFDRVEIYFNCSIIRVLSTFFFFWDMVIFLSFELIILNVMFFLGIFMIFCIDFLVGFNGIFFFVSSIVFDVVLLFEVSFVFRKSFVVVMLVGLIVWMCFLIFWFSELNVFVCEVDICFLNFGFCEYIFSLVVKDINVWVKSFKLLFVCVEDCVFFKNCLWNLFRRLRRDG